VAVVTCRCEVRNRPGVRVVVGAKDLEELFVVSHEGRKYEFYSASGTVSVYCRKCNTTQRVTIGRTGGNT
jgi:hypothetical protein